MNRRQLLWQLTAQQFAAFDTHLYLDTHPEDKKAMQMFGNYMKNFGAYRKEYESLYGPLTADSQGMGTKMWIDDPWPWEKEAN